MLHHNLTLNFTSLSVMPKTWNFIFGFSLVVCVTALIINSLVLLLFIKQSHLRTPFTIYIINLLIANLFNELFQQPLAVVSQLRSFTSLGTSFCTAFLYGSYVIHSAVYNSHFLITLNRIWAVTHPLSYRHYHTKKVAITTCIWLWIYIHLISLPGYVTDAMYYRIPLEYGCFMDKKYQVTWFVVEQLILYDIPLVALILAYPIICFCEFRQRVRRRRLIRQGTEDITMSVRPPVSRSYGNEIRLAVKPAQSKRSSTTFVVLTILTLSNCLFMLPLTVAYNLGSFTEMVPRLGTVLQISSVLFYVQAVVDPILFTFALEDLRNAAFAVLRSSPR